ncbi:MAG: glycosyltransferase [Bacteroidia bacterium]|nr:glycosyltransferase [Bacteroidia bacterium]
MKGKTTIMILIDWFAPGFRAGGPIRSCVNLALALQKDCEIFVVTTDTDLGEDEPYREIESDQWIDYSERVKVWYFSRKGLRMNRLESLLREIAPDFVYLNSMFSVPFTIWPLWLMVRGRTEAKIILAPRGMLKPAALAYNPLKKQVYLKLMRFSGIPRKIIFHATNPEEAHNIRTVLGQETHVRIAPNLPQMFQKPLRKITKQPGKLKLAFLGRVHPYKNLLWLLQRLGNLRGNVKLNIYGPMEDESYWDQCTDVISALPENIVVNYEGGLQPDEVTHALEASHFHTLPTQGENFGHAIFESFLVGRPVIISDRTPWLDLEENKAGWVIPLNEPRQYEMILQKALEMSQEEYDIWAEKSWNYAQEYIRNSQLKEKYLALFSTI